MCIFMCVLWTHVYGLQMLSVTLYIILFIDFEYRVFVVCFGLVQQPTILLIFPSLLSLRGRVIGVRMTMLNLLSGYQHLNSNMHALLGKCFYH